MYARTTTVQGNPTHVDDGIALVRDEVMPALLGMDGCIGVSMLVDREDGSAIVTSSWETREAMHASNAAVAPLRDRAQQVMGGRPEVREWDIAVLHRSRPIPEGACARVTWTRIDPKVLDPMLAYFRMSVLPEIEQLPGFCSASLLVDHTTGHGALAAVYDSAEALAASRDAAMMLRSDATTKMEAELIDVATFEVAVAHLRVPETV